jgi:hypothetical protein
MKKSEIESQNSQFDEQKKYQQFTLELVQEKIRNYKDQKIHYKTKDTADVAIQTAITKERTIERVYSFSYF